MKDKRTALLGAVVGTLAIGAVALSTTTSSHATGVLAAGAGSTVTAPASGSATPAATSPSSTTTTDATGSSGTSAPRSTTASSGRASLSVHPTVKVDGLKAITSFTLDGAVHAESAVLAQPTYTQVLLGDGEQYGSDGGSMTCSTKDPLRPIHTAFPAVPHTYAEPGTYTITFKVGYCGDKGGTTVTTTRKVTVGNGPVDEDPGSRIDPGPNAKGVSARANGYLLEAFPGYCTPVMSEDTGLRTTTVRLTTPDQGRQSYLVVLKAADGKQVKAHIEADGDSRVLVPLSWHAGSLDFSIHVYVESAARAPEVVAVSSSGGAEADRMSRWCAAPKGGSGTTPSATATGPIVVTG
ncbi:hypothetical protein PZ938_10880 [Luteipulveratus sp. YIM 133132]|uniref:hypothetical protein n=1 Tax=Luteipulveratus flavus TaxID=3031728 RepID=UPI0023AEA9AE|nr:hypothetical protein [Luteipulveratus sp. YIM 133132]MDE9366109.1 hypothetical protein [Luteipulveratus sp. YIM 133132]